MSEQGYIQGVKIRLEVDDAELNLLQAKGNLSRAKRNYILSLTQLDWVMGVLGENNNLKP
jgi:outer membrane protein TolC